MSNHNAQVKSWCIFQAFVDFSCWCIFAWTEHMRKSCASPDVKTTDRFVRSTGIQLANKFFAKWFAPMWFAQQASATDDGLTKCAKRSLRLVEFIALLEIDATNDRLLEFWPLKTIVLFNWISFAIGISLRRVSFSVRSIWTHFVDEWASNNFFSSRLRTLASLSWAHIFLINLNCLCLLLISIALLARHFFFLLFLLL